MLSRTLCYTSRIGLGIFGRRKSANFTKTLINRYCLSMPKIDQQYEQQKIDRLKEKREIRDKTWAKVEEMFVKLSNSCQNEIFYVNTIVNNDEPHFGAALARIPALLFEKCTNGEEKMVEKFVLDGPLKNLCLCLQSEIDNDRLYTVDAAIALDDFDKLNDKFETDLFKTVLGPQFTLKLALHALTKNIRLRFDRFDTILNCISGILQSESIDKDEALAAKLAVFNYYCRSIMMLGTSKKHTLDYKLILTRTLHRIVFQFDLNNQNQPLEPAVCDFVCAYLDKIGDHIFEANLASTNVMTFLLKCSDIFLKWNIRFDDVVNQHNPRRTDWRRKYIFRFLRLAQMYKQTKHVVMGRALLNFLKIILENCDVEEIGDENNEYLDILRQNRQLLVEILQKNVEQMEQEVKDDIIQVMKARFSGKYVEWCAEFEDILKT